MTMTYAGAEIKVPLRYRANPLVSMCLSQLEEDPAVE